MPWVTGAAVMLRSAALQASGLFDDGFFLYFEETELLWRLRRRGWQIWNEPRARIVHEGGVATQIRDPKTGVPFKKPMPRYWYEARKRYFALTGGRGHAFVAGLAWLCGDAFWRLRRMITRQADDSTQRVARDLIAYGLWPRHLDSRPAAVHFADPPGQVPAWMRPGR